MQEKTGIHPQKPVKKESEKPGKALAGVFSQDIVNQLNVVFSRMDGKLQLELHGFSSGKPGIKKLYAGAGKIYGQADCA